ncbi:MAG: hypothetical protein Q4B28_08725 [bacterium]|nr:hypothetical protein [bacterium]
MKIRMEEVARLIAAQALFLGEFTQKIEDKIVVLSALEQTLY